MNWSVHNLAEARKGGGEMTKKLIRKSDESNVEAKKMAATTDEKNEKVKAEDTQKITLPGPPYFTGKRNHN